MSPRRLEVIFMGACDVQLAIDYFREMAALVGVEVHSSATSAADFAILSERKPDVLIVGGGELVGRLFETPWRSTGASESVLSELDLAKLPSILSPKDIVPIVRKVLTGYRRLTSCPILLQNVPAPTSSPLGFAARGRDSFANIAREVNLLLADVSLEFDDVFIVDIDNLYSLHGKRRLLDDTVLFWGHLGSTTGLRDFWLRHKASQAVRDLDPDKHFAAFGHSEELEFERLLAAEQLSMVMALNGIGRKKLVICDLDNTLWPGVIAETESPFGTEAVSRTRIDLTPWLGIHEALRAVLHRGFMLACCSKNDEAVVRKYWKYTEGSIDFLLTLEDFVTVRINWEEKVENIKSIVAELNIGLDSVVLIDDNPVERDKIQKHLPEVTVLGDNLFTVRDRLLTGPEFQVTKVTEESRDRSQLMKQQAQRRSAQVLASSSGEDIKSLEISVEVGRVSSPILLDRIHELINKTNQFNTTAIRYTKEALRSFIDPASDKGLYAMRVRDRFGAYGLIGACLTSGHHIELYVMSCRVIGMGVERVLMGFVIDAVLERFPTVTGSLILTDRNTPARNLFKGNGFVAKDGGIWELDPSSSERPWLAKLAELYATSNLRETT